MLIICEIYHADIVKLILNILNNLANQKKQNKKYNNDNYIYIILQWFFLRSAYNKSLLELWNLLVYTRLDKRFLYMRNFSTEFSFLHIAYILFNYIFNYKGWF